MKSSLSLKSFALRDLAFVAILLLISLSSLYWLPADTILAHGPVYPWPHSSTLLDIAVRHLFSWIDISGYGSPNAEPTGFLFLIYAALVSMITGSSHLAQSFFFFVGFTGCSVSMFILARSLGFTPITALFASVFYLLSPVTMSGMPVEIVNMRLLPYHVATPILVWIVVRATRDPFNKRELAILGIVSLLLGSAGYSSLQYFLLNLVIIGTYCLIIICLFWSEQRKRNRIIFYSFTILTILLLTNYYWLNSIVSDLGGAYANRAEPGFKDVALIRGLSAKVIDAIRMVPYPEHANLSPWIAYYNTWHMILITLTLVAMGAFAFLSNRTRDLAIFPGVLLILGLFLCKGTNEPLGFLGHAVFFSHRYFTRLFRNPTYFELVVVFALAMLVALGVSEFIRIVSSRPARYLISWVGLITIFTGSYGLPFICGAPIREQKANSVSQFNKVPAYYAELVSFFCGTPGSYRINCIPIFTRQDWFVAYEWSNLFVGAPFLNLWSGRPVVRPIFPFSDGHISRLFDLVMHPREDIISPDAWIILLKVSNVRFVVLHEDIATEALHNYYSNRDVRKTREFILDAPYLKKVREYEKITLYEVNNDAYLPRIYAVSSR